MRLSIVTPTHDPRWLGEAWRSIACQDHADWEWVISVNHKDGKESRLRWMKEELKWIEKECKPGCSVKIVADPEPFKGVGQRKKFAFEQASGEILIELDHDDLLAPGALTAIDHAFADPQIGFVYSDWIDFEADAPRGDAQGMPYTYRGTKRPDWEKNGFRFYETDILGGARPGRYEAVRSFPPSALATSLIFWAPNHVRAWRASIYRAIGGHDPTYRLCDDHELCCRTYLATKWKHIPSPLYLYRATENTFSKHEEEIAAITHRLQGEYLHRLVAREAELRDLPRLDLGGAISPEPGWIPVDISPEVVNLRGIQADLREKWPWPDNSVGAFRAHDFLEHLPDVRHTMREIWRCLVPGGWLLSLTPSTDGRGAFQDPTHLSFFNQNSFWYWTRKQQAQYINNVDIRFQPVSIFTHYPSPWHEENKISYVHADLVALKPGYDGPGVKTI